MSVPCWSNPTKMSWICAWASVQQERRKCGRAGSSFARAKAHIGRSGVHTHMSCEAGPPKSFEAGPSLKSNRSRCWSTRGELRRTSPNLVRAESKEYFRAFTAGHELRVGGGPAFRCRDHMRGAQSCSALRANMRKAHTLMGKQAKPETGEEEGKPTHDGESARRGPNRSVGAGRAEAFEGPM